MASLTSRRSSTAANALSKAASNAGLSMASLNFFSNSSLSLSGPARGLSRVRRAITLATVGCSPTAWMIAWKPGCRLGSDPSWPSSSSPLLATAGSAVTASARPSNALSTSGRCRTTSARRSSSVFSRSPSMSTRVLHPTAATASRPNSHAVCTARLFATEATISAKYSFQSATMADLPKNYEPKEIEPRWYAEWVARGYFHADATAPKAPFSMVIPPPNVTGSLHMGHALGTTIEDIFTRWRRMAAYNAMWLPGTDHAGIATQMVAERELREREGKTRHDIGREAFVERVWDWRKRTGDRILEQLKRMGCSLDWDRTIFTMDPPYSAAVVEAFVRLYEEGLIYRARRLINWCPSCRTALSDLEVDFDEGTQGELYEFAYPMADGSGEIIVATTRPETMLGDTAIAVHPDDPRHQAKIGKRVRHPLVDREFPIIADPILVD